MNDCEILYYEFPGTSVARHEFCELCFEEVIPVIGERHFGFLQFVLEVIKNIYDHADGSGRLIMLKRERSFEFEIKDYGQLSYNLEEIKCRGSRLIGNGRNFGCGICRGMIEGLAQGLEITYTLDTSHGFCYHGTFEQKPAF